MSPNSGSIAAAVAAVRSGVVLAIPTDTVYGLAVDPRREGATGDLFRVKGRPESAPLPVLVGSREDAASLALIGDDADAVIDRYWPGALTLVLPRAAAAQSFELGGDEATIGLRWPANEVATAILTIAGPLAVTSANRHGEPACHTADDVRRSFGESVLVLDGGICDAMPSTVVSLTGDRPRLLREGAVPFGEIMALCAKLERAEPTGPASGLPRRHPAETADGDDDGSHAPDRHHPDVVPADP